MRATPLHVVFGTGQVIGLALAARLSDAGLAVRSVSRHPPGDPDRRASSGAAPMQRNATAAADAAAGASVVYQCLNAPYTKWPELFPPLQRGVLAAAEGNDALLVTLENLYAYGPTGGVPMTEDLPLVAATSKGRTRAAMTAELLAAADAGMESASPSDVRRTSSEQVSPSPASENGSSATRSPASARTSSAIPTSRTPTAIRPTSSAVSRRSAPTVGPSVRSGTCQVPRRSRRGRSWSSSRMRLATPWASVASPRSSCAPWDW